MVWLSKLKLTRLTMLKLLAFTAIMYSGAAFAADAPTPCQGIPSGKFYDYTTSNIEIIDVGAVKKEGAGNVCSVQMDTSKGRIKFVFTTDLSINGDGLIRKISVALVNN